MNIQEMKKKVNARGRKIRKGTERYNKRKSNRAKNKVARASRRNNR